MRARQQRRRYLEDRRKVVIAQRAGKRWLARRHKAATVIQQTVREFLQRRRQERVQRGIVKAQVLDLLMNFGLTGIDGIHLKKT